MVIISTIICAWFLSTDIWALTQENLTVLHAKNIVAAQSADPCSLLSDFVMGLRIMTD